MEYPPRSDEYQEHSLRGVEDVVAAAKEAVVRHNPLRQNDAGAHVHYLTLAIVAMLQEATPDLVGNDERSRRLDEAVATLRGSASTYFKRT